MVAHTVHTYGPGEGWPRVMQILAAVAACVGWVYSRGVEVDVVDGTDDALRPGRGTGGDGSNAPKGSHTV
jgi:hypothetical protein